MIESFNVPTDKIAQWAGTTSAIFSLSQAMTGIWWGQASDRFGRKPAILAGLVCTMTSSILFGFSRSLVWALLARALGGLANGNVGTIRTTVAELVPQKELQPRAFSIMPLVWTIGIPGLRKKFGTSLTTTQVAYWALLLEEPWYIPTSTFRACSTTVRSSVGTHFVFLGLWVASSSW
jgi:MFS family permease